MPNIKKNKTKTNAVAPEGEAVPTWLVTSVILLLNEPEIIWYQNHIGHL